LVRIGSERIVCVGSVSFDLIFEVDRMPDEHEKLRCPRVHSASGGSAANTAYWLARLGHNVAFAGCVGDDEMGRACVSELREVGVDTAGIQVTPQASTGVASVFVSQDDKRMVTASGANAFFDADRLIADDIGPKVHVHASLLADSGAVAVLRRAKERGATTSCEFNGVQSAKRVRYCDICFMNLDELRRWLGPEAPLTRWKELFEQLDTWLVVTQGDAGAKAVRQDEMYRAPAVPTLAVDRTGGGDAFDAAYLAGIAWGLGSQASLELALELASLVIRHIGARPREIGEAQLRELLRWPSK